MENRDQWGNGEQQESKIQQEKEKQGNEGLENKEQENKEYQFIREKVISKRKKRLERMGVAFVFTVFLAVVFGVVARAAFLYADGPLRKIMGLGEDVTPSTNPTPTPSATPTGKPSDSTNPAATTTPDKDKTTPTQSAAMGDGEDKAGVTGIPGHPGTTGNPGQTDPNSPNHSGDSDVSPAPGQENPSKNPGNTDNPNNTDTNQTGVPGNPDSSGQDGSGNNPSGNKNPGQTYPGKDGTEDDPSGKNESGNQESENPESGDQGDKENGDKENPNSKAPEGSGSQTTPEGPDNPDSQTAPENPENSEDSKNPNSSGDSNSPGTSDGDNPEDANPSGSPQPGDGDSQDNEKEENGNNGNEGSKEGSTLGYAAMYAELQGIAGQVGKSLVTVTVTVNGIDWLNDPYEAISHTTGVVIEKTAEHLLVLLNLDRIQSASSIQLAIGGENFGADLWNYDKDYNLAVVAVESSKIPERYWNQVQVAEWGDSASLAAGTPILALGNPNGYMGSMEFGMVTSSGSTYYIMDNSVTLFNTNTTDSESGDGVIVNLEGKIIGIITRTMKSELNASMCTAIGISNLENVLAKLEAGEKLISFGILGEDIPASVLEEEGLHNGIYVMEVIAESPAFEAGIKMGDIILMMDDAEVYSYSQFNTLLNLHEKGDSIRVRIRRTVRMHPQEIVVRAVLEVK